MRCLIGACACGCEPPACAHVPVPVLALVFSFFAPALCMCVPSRALASFSWDPSRASIPPRKPLPTTQGPRRPAHTPPPGPVLAVDGHRVCCIFKPLFQLSPPHPIPNPILSHPASSQGLRAPPLNCAGSKLKSLPRARFPSSRRFSFRSPRILPPTVPADS